MKEKPSQNLPTQGKPTIIAISPGISPYRTHLLRRIAEEIPEYALRTIYTCEYSMAPWRVPQPPSINAMVMGEGEFPANPLGISGIWSGWIRHRQIVREIRASNTVALILGYGTVSDILTIEWCHRKGIHCLLSGDSNILGDKNPPFKAWFKKLVVTKIVSYCSAILAFGSLGRQYYQKYGARPEQIFSMASEPDYSLIENISPETIQSLSAEFQLDPHRRRLLYSGRLANVKRVDLLIEAFAQIADQRPDWDLLIVGGGPLEAALKASVPSRLRDRVVWTGFIESPQSMFAFYRLAEVLVLPSDYEPWAMVVNEAACAGLALICSDVVGAAAELLHDGENGRFFRTGDAASLTTALLDVTDNANLCRYQASSLEILENWRKNADPVEGLRQALEFCFRPATAPAADAPQK